MHARQTASSIQMDIKGYNKEAFDFFGGTEAPSFVSLSGSAALGPQRIVLMCCNKNHIFILNLILASLLLAPISLSEIPQRTQNSRETPHSTPDDSLLPKKGHKKLPDEPERSKSSS